MTELPVWVLLILGNIGVFIVLSIMKTYTAPSVGQNIQTNIVIFGAITAVLLLMFGIAAYIYFSSNLNYMPLFVICMICTNLFLNGISTTAAVLHFTKS